MISPAMAAMMAAIRTAPAAVSLAKIAKDTAAGAVLIAAIMAAIAGLIIFVPKGLVFLGLL